jgi:hypothetical protein
MGIHQKTINAIRVFDMNDFTNADRFGKMRIWEQYPDYFTINETDRRHWEAMHEAFLLVKNEISNERSVTKIMQKMRGFEGRRQAERLFGDMCAYVLSDDSAQLNKEWKKRQTIERLELIADKLMQWGIEKDKPELLIQSAEVSEKAAKLAGLYELADLNKINVTDWKPKQIIAIKKPLAIEKAEIEEVENE